MEYGIELNELKHEIEKNKDSIQRLSDLQMRHEHQDEIRAVKQDQLIANIEVLVGNLKDYQTELHEMSLKNTEDITHLETNQAKISTRVKILYSILALIGGAVLCGLFEWLPYFLQSLGKGK